MTAQELSAVINGVAPVIREFYQAQIAGLKAQLDAERVTFLDLMAKMEQRLAVAEQRPMLAGPEGPAGKDGAAGANGKDGRDGVDGKDGQPGANGTDGAAGLNGKDGRDGIDGKDGAAGLNGKDGADGLAGKDGRDGIDGKDGAAGANGKDGADGLHGKDGIGIIETLINRDGQLVLTMSDGSTKNAGVIVGKDGAPGVNGKDGRDGIDGKDGANGIDGKDGAPGLNGKDGAPGINGKDGANGMDGKDGAAGLNGKDGVDGLSFDEFDLAYDQMSGFVITATAGERTKSQAIPVPHHTGVWQAGRLYEQGSMVTSKGSTFVAMRQTKASPEIDGAPSSDWKLVAKRGRDGKDGKDGKNGDEV